MLNKQESKKYLRFKASQLTIFAKVSIANDEEPPEKANATDSRFLMIFAFPKDDRNLCIHPARKQVLK